MANASQIEHSRAKTLDLVGKFYDMLTVGKAEKVSFRDWAVLLEARAGHLGDVRHDLVAVGAATSKHVGTQDGNGRPTGSASEITLLIPQDEAVARLRAAWEITGTSRVEPTRTGPTPMREREPEPEALPQGVASIEPVASGELPEPEHKSKAVPEPKREPVAIAVDPGEETRAIVGPDAPNPMEVLARYRKNEAGALLEAARQYIQRGALVAQAVALLGQAGIAADDIHLPGVMRDERMETVALLLPMFEDMARQMGRMEHRLAATSPEIEREQGRIIDRQRGQIERLVADNTALRQILAEHGIPVPPPTFLVSNGNGKGTPLHSREAVSA